MKFIITGQFLKKGPAGLLTIFLLSNSLIWLSIDHYLFLSYGGKSLADLISSLNQGILGLQFVLEYSHTRLFLLTLFWMTALALLVWRIPSQNLHFKYLVHAIFSLFWIKSAGLLLISWFKINASLPLILLICAEWIHYLGALVVCIYLIWTIYHSPLKTKDNSN